MRLWTIPGCRRTLVSLKGLGPWWQARSREGKDCLRLGFTYDQLILSHLDLWLVYNWRSDLIIRLICILSISCYRRRKMTQLTGTRRLRKLKKWLLTMFSSLPWIAPTVLSLSMSSPSKKLLWVSMLMYVYFRTKVCRFSIAGQVSGYSIKSLCLVK